MVDDGESYERNDCDGSDEGCLSFGDFATTDVDVEVSCKHHDLEEEVGCAPK